MFKRLKKILHLIGIPTNLPRSERPKDLFDQLMEMPWWISVALAALVYVPLAIVLPSLELPDIPWVIKYAWYAHQFAPFIALVFLMLAAQSAFLSRYKRKQREQTQKELLEVYRVLGDERTATGSVEHTGKHTQEK